MKIRALLTAAALTAAVPALAQAPQAKENPGQAKKEQAAQGAGAQGTPGQMKKAPPKGESARAMVKDAQRKTWLPCIVRCGMTPEPGLSSEPTTSRQSSRWRM